MNFIRLSITLLRVIISRIRRIERSNRLECPGVRGSNQHHDQVEAMKDKEDREENVSTDRRARSVSLDVRPELAPEIKDQVWKIKDHPRIVCFQLLVRQLAQTSSQFVREQNDDNSHYDDHNVVEDELTCEKSVENLKYNVRLNCLKNEKKDKLSRKSTPRVLTERRQILALGDRIVENAHNDRERHHAREAQLDLKSK